LVCSDVSGCRPVQSKSKQTPLQLDLPAPGLPLHEVRASSALSVLSLVSTGQSASALCHHTSLLRFQDHFSCSQMCGARGKTFDEDGGCGTTAQAFAEGEQPRMYLRVSSLFMHLRVSSLFMHHRVASLFMYLDVASLNSGCP
jgi:hypothetical protein